MNTAADTVDLKSHLSEGIIAMRFSNKQYNLETRVIGTAAGGINLFLNVLNAKSVKM